MIGCSASWMVTKFPNSFGLAILPLRMSAVCGSNTLRTLSETYVSPPSTRARVGAGAVRRRWLSRRAMRIASLTTARVVAINHRGHGSGERRGDDH